MVDDKVAGGLEEIKVVERMVSVTVDFRFCKPCVGDQVRADRPGEVTIQ